MDKTINLAVCRQPKEIHFNQSSTSIHLSAASELRIVKAISPSVEICQIDDGVIIKIRDVNGLHMATIHNGSPGTSYTLTESDIQQIALSTIDSMNQNEVIFDGGGA